MKKRIIALALAAVMAVSLLVMPAAAASVSRFSDVTDGSTAAAVEVLRLMGVLDGYNDGTFRPDAVLTRAQFSKMASYATDGSGELGRYRTVTIFPDVKPSHWAAAYINLAARGRGIISGYPDGKFYPDNTVTMAQAVTILLRVLGYEDAAVGGIWPDSYLALAKEIGLTDGVYAAGGAGVTRAQAARLFVNLLGVQTADGGTLYALGEETDLIAVDGGSGELKTADGKVYSMVIPAVSSALVGSRGRVVLNEKGTALTFLPTSSGNTGVSNAAVIVSADRSAAGFDALAGNSDYTIYKNGQQVGPAALRKYDVATYHAASNAIRVCDTRLTVWYENCAPSPDAPARITVLGQDFNVLPTGRDSLAEFRPGQVVTLLLTADGQVAGAVKSGTAEARGNAVALVTDGVVKLLCGNSLLELTGITADESYDGCVVHVSSNGKNSVIFSVQEKEHTGSLDLRAGTLSGTKLAENALIFANGKPVGSGQLGSSVSASRIIYTRTDWAGEIDLVVLRDTTDEIYGRVILDRVKMTDEEGNIEWEESMSVVWGNGAADRVGPFGNYYVAGHGAFVAARLNRNKDDFTSMEKLTKLTGVSASAWIGSGAVTVGGRSYAVAEDLCCYNADADIWITLEEARAYSNTADLYVRDDIVRILVVGG